jgi:phage shock protein A
MVNNRILLGSIAFGVSFGISLIVTRDLGRASLTGITTLPAVYLAASVVNRRYHWQAENRVAILTSHIAALQQRRMETYQEFSELMAEKERVAMALNSMQLQLRQLQLSGSPPPYSQPALSWDLVGAPPAVLPPEVPPYAAPTEIQTPAQPDVPLSQVVSEATATKRKIEASLRSLQTELTNLKAQAAEHRQTRDRLVQEITQLHEQKQQLGMDSAALKQEVQDLNYCRQELERFIDYAETKKQELDAGRHPLQLALRQLQAEINNLHEELRTLEAQVSDRRTQKAALDEQLVVLQAQLPFPTTSVKSGAVKPVPAKPEPIPSEPAKSKPARADEPPAKSEGKPDSNSKPARSINGPLQQDPPPQKDTAKPTRESGKHPLRQIANTIAAVTLPNLPKAEKLPQSELPQEWTELMLQLPAYEVQVLKTIVEQNNPAPAIKRIAEENLTMPELLIDLINERALDTIGDLIIDSRAGIGAAAIVPEHLKLVKQLIKTYEDGNG